MATSYELQFTPGDSHSSGGDELRWEVWTGAGATGVMVASGDATAGVPQTPTIADGGLDTGNNSRWLRVYDGAGGYDEDEFVVTGDGTVEAHSYDVTFTPSDVASTGSGELSWALRTAAAGGGAVLAQGTATSAGAVNGVAILDNALNDGENSRWLRISDGAGNLLDKEISVEALFQDPTVSDSAAGNIVFTATADGEVIDHFISASTSADVEFFALADGVTTPLWDSVVATIAFTAVAEGFLFTPHVSDSASASLDFTASADGVLAFVWSSTSSTIELNALAGGVVTPIWSSATGDAEFTALAGGVIAYLWAAAAGQIVFTATADGEAGDPFIASTANGSIMFTATAKGFAWPVQTSIPNISGRRREPLFYLTLYPPVGSPDHERRLDVVDINPLLTGISWQTSWPGGFSTLTAGYDLRESALDRPLANPLLPREMVTRDYAHVLLTDGRLTIWEGRLGEEDRAPHSRKTLAARGYGYTALSDHPWITSSDTPTQTDVIVRSVIAEAAPAVRPASSRTFQPPLEERIPIEFAWWHPLQVLDQLHIEGDSQGLRMDWGVWENRRLHVYPRQAPAIADYWIPYESRFLVDWRYIPPEAGQVYVRHTVDGEETVTGPVTNTRFVRDVGFQKSIVLPAGEVSVDGATRIARTWLHEQRRGRDVGQVTIGPDDAVMAPGGRPVPSYLVRAGQWIQVGDHEALLIVTHEHNPNTGRTRLQIGDRVTSYTARVNAMLRDQEREKRGMHPGGGRIR